MRRVKRGWLSFGDEHKGQTTPAVAATSSSGHVIMADGAANIGLPKPLIIPNLGP